MITIVKVITECKFFQKRETWFEKQKKKELQIRIVIFFFSVKRNGIYKGHCKGGGEGSCGIENLLTLL